MSNDVTDGLCDYVDRTIQQDVCGSLVLGLWYVLSISISVTSFGSGVGNLWSQMQSQQYFHLCHRLFNEETQYTVLQPLLELKKKHALLRQPWTLMLHLLLQRSLVLCKQSKETDIESWHADAEAAWKKPSILRNARKRETRLRGKVADLLHRVKKMQLLSTKAEELLQAYKHIPLHLLSGKVGQKFTDEQKQFAISLHYYSPAAYQYVRRRFNLLPCPRTIRSWLARTKSAVIWHHCTSEWKSEFISIQTMCCPHWWDGGEEVCRIWPDDWLSVWLHWHRFRYIAFCCWVHSPWVCKSVGTMATVVTEFDIDREGHNGARLGLIRCCVPPRYFWLFYFSWKRRVFAAFLLIHLMFWFDLKQICFALDGIWLP